MGGGTTSFQPWCQGLHLQLCIGWFQGGLREKKTAQKPPLQQRVKGKGEERKSLPFKTRLHTSFTRPYTSFLALPRAWPGHVPPCFPIPHGLRNSSLCQRAALYLGLWWLQWWLAPYDVSWWSSWPIHAWMLCWLQGAQWCNKLISDYVPGILGRRKKNGSHPVENITTWFIKSLSIASKMHNSL